MEIVRNCSICNLFSYSYYIVFSEIIFNFYIVFSFHNLFSISFSFSYHSITGVWPCHPSEWPRCNYCAGNSSCRVKLWSHYAPDTGHEHGLEWPIPTEPQASHCSRSNNDSLLQWRPTCSSNWRRSAHGRHTETASSTSVQWLPRSERSKFAFFH